MTTLNLNDLTLPASWNLRTLGDLCTFSYGDSLPEKKRMTGPFPVYGSNGIVGYHTKALVNSPAIIIGRKGSIGKINISYVDCWPIDTTYYISNLNNEVDFKWFTYCLKILGLENLNKAAAVPGLNRNDAYSIKIPLPPLETQKKIAAILDKADELRQKRKAAIEKLDQLAQSVFLDMFGDPVTNPKGWELKKLKSISNIFSDGPFGSNLKTEHYRQHGIRVIRLQNIGCGVFNNDYKNFVDQKHYELALKKHTCYPGDLVVATMGNPNIRAAIVPGYIDIAINKADCILCRPKLEITNVYYLNSLLNQQAFISLASNLFHGQTRSRVSMGQLSQVAIPMPPIELQNEFGSIIDVYYHNLKRMRHSESLLNLQFNSLMQKAFTGEII